LSYNILYSIGRWAINWTRSTFTSVPKISLTLATNRWFYLGSADLEDKEISLLMLADEYIALIFRLAF